MLHKQIKAGVFYAHKRGKYDNPSRVLVLDTAKDWYLRRVRWTATMTEQDRAQCRHESGAGGMATALEVEVPVLS